MNGASVEAISESTSKLGISSVKDSTSTRLSVETANLPTPSESNASPTEGYYGSEVDLGGVEETKVTIEGVLINYAKCGHGKHNVLCLAGSLGAWHTDFAETLVDFDHDRFTLIAWDAPGYGKSRPPNRPKTANSNQYDAGYAHKLMVSLQLTPYSVIGWSDGGATALCLAGNRQSAAYVRGVVTLGATAYITEKMCNIYKILMSVSQLSPERKLAYMTVYDEDYLQLILEQHMNSRIDIFNNRKGNKCMDLLPNIKCPVLILHGARDPLVAEEHPRYLCKNIKNSKMLTKYSGDHTLHLKYHSWYKRCVQQFLTSIDEAKK